MSKNSWGNESLYLTYTPDYVVNKYLSVSANIGIATNYRCDDKYGGLHSDYCSKSGVVFLPAVSIDYSPFGNNFAVAAGITPMAAMFSVNYRI